MDSFLTPPTTPPTTPAPEQLPMTIHSLTPSAASPILAYPLQQPEILTARTNWDTWAKSIKLRAILEGVWEYCDPDAPERIYHELEEPEKPHVSTIRPEATSIVDLGDADFIELSTCVDRYWRDCRAWENRLNSIQTISDLIRSHVDGYYTGHIEHETDPRKQMVILAAACRPSQLTTLQPEWENIQIMASQPVIQEFFKRWNMFFAKCNEHVYHHSFANERALWDLLEQRKDPHWKWESLANQLWIRPLEDMEMTEKASK